MSSKASHDIGWIGLGRMGEAMAARLVKAGHGISVWNRTASKADPLAKIGAEVVTDKAAMAHCATVFTMVSTTDDLKDILFGKGGVLTGNARPKRVVDMSSISDSGSAEIRKGLGEAGVAYLSAPVSGNAKVAKAGKLLVVASGPKAEYDAVQPLLAALGRSAMYVGEGELSRIWKIAHNTMFGVIIHSLCEITLLAEKAGIPRHVFLESINQSVLGSMYTRYKTPGLVNLDFTTTFTPTLAAEGHGARHGRRQVARRHDADRLGDARQHPVAVAPVSRRHRLLRAAARAGARRRHEARAGEREGERWAAVALAARHSRGASSSCGARTSRSARS